MAQRAPEAAASLPGVQVVIGNAHRLEIPRLIEEAMQEEKICKVDDILRVREYEPLFALSQEGHTRANIKIQEGCCEFCTYCIIPYVRGPIRSRAAEDVLAEAGRLARKGYKEIVLTGIHLASYGREHGGGMDALYQLLADLHQVEGIERIRLGSLEPTLMLGEFIRKAADLPKLCPHFHISMQSGSDTVLARMKRKYTAEEFLQALDLVRSAIDRPAITTDVIAGFPGETEEEHRQTMEVLKRAQFARVHVFPYSPREGTPAARMSGQLTRQVKEARAHQLAQIGRESAISYAQSFIGECMPVLFERKMADGLWHGFTTNYLDIAAQGEAESGRIMQVSIEGLTDDGLCGRII